MKNFCAPILLLCAACSTPATSSPNLTPAAGPACCAPGCCDDEPACCMERAVVAAPQVADAACCVSPVGCCEPQRSVGR